MEIIKINKYTQHSPDEKKILRRRCGPRREEGNRKSQEIIDVDSFYLLKYLFILILHAVLSSLSDIHLTIGSDDSDFLGIFISDTLRPTQQHLILLGI